MSKNNISKKKIFDLKLYKEGMRQLKVLGLITLIIYIIEAILIAMNEYEFSGIRVIGLTSIHPIAYFTFAIVAPLFTLYLFGFLNSRTASDFYHSLPHTRTCIITSFTAAIVSWIFIILASSSALAIAIHACLSDKYNIAYKEIFMMLTGIFIASLLVVSATVLAKCITGTLLTNIGVTGIILFFPCYMAEMFKTSIMSKCGHLLSSDYFLPSLSGGNNLITSLMIKMFFNNDSGTLTSNFTSPRAFLYTFSVSIILFGLAIFFFNRRNSETAGNSAPNKYIQALYRMCFTIALCMFPILLIFGETANTTEIVSIYIIIVILYFLFEITTTKSIKRVVKIIPGLAVIVILNIVLIISINLTADNVLNFKPDADDISYIKVLPSDFSYSYENENVYNYTDLIRQNIKIQDDDISEYVSNSLANQQTIMEYSDRYLMEIHTKDGKTHYRNIIARNKLATAINEYYMENSDFSDYINTLPDYKSVSVFPTDTIKGKDLKELYKTLADEYKTLSDEKKYNIINDAGTKVPPISSLSLTFKYKGRTTELWLQITGDLPETVKKYVNIMCKTDNSYEKAKRVLNDLQTYTAVSATDYISVIISYNQNNATANFDFTSEDFSKTNTTAELLKMLSEYVPTEPDAITDTLTSENGYYFISIDNTWDSFTCVVPVNDETANIYKQLEALKQND